MTRVARCELERDVGKVGGSATSLCHTIPTAQRDTKRRNTTDTPRGEQKKKTEQLNSTRIETVEIHNLYSQNYIKKRNKNAVEKETSEYINSARLNGVSSGFYSLPANSQQNKDNAVVECHAPCFMPRKAFLYHLHSRLLVEEWPFVSFLASFISLIS